ncbi:hypothetical protein D9M70_487770 [compost metagenome]
MGRLVDEQRQAETEQHLGVQGNREQQHGAAEGDPELGVAENGRVVAQADEDPQRLRLGQAKGCEARIEGKQQR